MFALRRLRQGFYSDSQTKRITEKLLKGHKITAFEPFNARHGLLGRYRFEETGKTITVNAAQYRDVIKNLTHDNFYDDLYETLSEGQL